MKNNDERDRDAEWVPVLIEENRGRKMSVLAMDVIIAKTTKSGLPRPREKRSSFVGEKSVLRVPLRSKSRDNYKDKDKSNEVKWNDRDRGRYRYRDQYGERDFFAEKRFFTNDEPSIDDQDRPFNGRKGGWRPIPLENPIARPIQALQPLRQAPEGWSDPPPPGPFPHDGHHNQPPIEVINSGQPSDCMVDLDQLLDNSNGGGGSHANQNFEEPRLDNFRRAETADFQRVAAASKHSSGGHSSDSGPRQQSRRYPYEHRGNDSEDDVVSLFSDGNGRCSISSYSDEREHHLRKGSLTQRPLPSRDEKLSQKPHQGSNDPFPNPFIAISGLQPERWQQSSSSDPGCHISSTSGDRNPMEENVNDHMDLRRLFGMSFTVPPSRPDSTYYSASDQMSSRCDPLSRPASRMHASPFSLRLRGPVDRSTRAIESNVAHRDYIHSGGQQYKSDFAIVKELGNDVSKDCESENGDCARLEATSGLRPQDQCSDGMEVHAIKNLKTTNTGSPLITPAGIATAAVILPQASLPIRPKFELYSSFPPCKEEDYTIAASEPSRISDELTKYFTYYCSVAGCIHSASPELCDLDSRNARTIHEGETHKVYVLEGLSKADLTAHIFKAHKIAIEDSRVCPLLIH
jgi:hypothetical protein